MVRSSLLALVTTVCLYAAGCGHWEPVPTPVNPMASTDPVTDMKTVLNMAWNPPILVEVTDQYLKGVWAQGYTSMLFYEQVARIGIIRRDEIYQVSAYDARGKEMFAYRPRMHDLPTCQKFLNAFYAISKKPVPPEAGAPMLATPPRAVVPMLATPPPAAQ